MDKMYTQKLLQIYKDENLYKRMTSRLQYLERIYNRCDKRLFAELVFCLLTPQTKARSACKATLAMHKENLLFSGTTESIANLLREYVRFHNMKAGHIVMARTLYFENGVFNLRNKIDDASKRNDVISLRNELAVNIKGLGMKEASHFLRNIGFGQNVAILDRHIMRVMERLEILPSGITSKSSLSKKNYLECEASLLAFSKLSKIPMEYLDFVLWYEATDDIFK